MDTLHAHLDPQISFPDSGSAREDLERQIESVIRLLTATPAGDAYLTLIAESRHDAELAAQLAERYIATRRDAAAEVMRRGVARGQLRRDLDCDAAIDALYGAVYYRLLVSHAPPGPGYAPALIEQIFGGLQAVA